MVDGGAASYYLEHSLDAAAFEPLEAHIHQLGGLGHLLLHGEAMVVALSVVTGVGLRWGAPSPSMSPSVGRPAYIHKTAPPVQLLLLMQMP